MLPKKQFSFSLNSDSFQIVLFLCHAFQFMFICSFVIFLGNVPSAFQLKLSLKQEEKSNNCKIKIIFELIINSEYHLLVYRNNFAG